MSTKAYENPLIPNQRLREMYLAMLQLRLLGRHLAGPRRKPAIPAGAEAIWTATAIGLRDFTGDLISEPGSGPALDSVLGASLKSLLKPSPTASPARLHPVGAPYERLTLALGASLGLAAAKQKSLLLAYASPSDLTRAQWKTLLGFALQAEAPIVFIALPDASATFDLAAHSQACGVPGISVEATDPIAIYRVAQECMVRARAAGGPALLAGVSFDLDTKARRIDPIALLASQILSRKAATQTWIDNAKAKLETVIAAYTRRP